MSSNKNIIQNNNFTGIIWDGQALEAVNNVSKALLNLTELFKSQNINMTMIHIDGDTKEKEE